MSEVGKPKRNPTVFLYKKPMAQKAIVNNNSAARILLVFLCWLINQDGTRIFIAIKLLVENIILEINTE